MQNYNSLNIIKRLLKNHIKPYYNKIIITILVMIVIAICSAANIALTQPLLDDIFINKDYQKLIYIAGLMILVSCVKAIAEYFQNYIMRFIGQKILTDLQMLLFNHLLLADLALIQSESSGKLISRLTNDIALMRNAVSTLLISIVREFLTVIGLLIVMISLEPKLSAIVLIVFPLAIYPVRLMSKNMRNIIDQTQNKLAQYTQGLDEVFLSIKIVKSYNGQAFEYGKAKTIVSQILDLYKQAIKLDSIVKPINEILSGIAVSIILVYGGFNVINGTSTPGSLMTFIAAFISAYKPFKSLLDLNINLQEGIAASTRLFQILDTKPTIFDSIDCTELKFNKPNIVFNNVSLTLNNRVILQNLNFEIPNAKTTAIVGESGSGKSSIINLLLKFYLPSNGQIFIGGQNIGNIQSKSLRNQIALVTQETLLFDTSIAQNIAYTTSASIQDIIMAAKQASAHDFIMQLPEQYNTIIGFQGYKLSGGQKQRISLARAFLKNASIMILDEATSSLDISNENIILESIKQTAKDITKIIITHKLPSIKNADHIILISNGKVLEQGSNTELINAKAHYYNLYQQQISKMQNQ